MVPPGGINLDYHPDHDQAATSLTSWPPVGAFVVLTLQPGEREVRLRNPWPSVEPQVHVAPLS